MTLAEFLNSDLDVATLVALARQGLAWWLDELAALLPTTWRERLSSRPSAWIEPHGAAWRLWKDGRESPAPSRAAGARMRVGLLAPAGMVLAREVPAPPMPAADVRRMVALDSDRLSPLAPELVHFDVEIIDRGTDGGRQRLLVGIIERAEAAALLAAARGNGFAPVALSARVGGEGMSPRFDFLPGVVQASGGAVGDRIRRYWWIAAVALIVANLALLVGRDMIDVARLRHAVDGQRPGVDAVARLRRRVMSEDDRRRELVALGLRDDPLRLLDVLTKVLPAGSSVQHLEWNGKALRIAGFGRPDSDVGAAIQSTGLFTNPKVVIGTPTTGAATFRPFDLSADRQTRMRP